MSITEGFQDLSIDGAQIATEPLKKREEKEKEGIRNVSITN